MALFSANEEADDLATSRLRYLLPPFWLAQVLSRPVERSPQLRLPALEQSLQRHSRCALHQRRHGCSSCCVGACLCLLEHHCSGP